jgi:hypothetical protein
MSERVDTLGWDVVIGIPLAVANAHISEDMALSKLSFDFDASDATSTTFIRGLVNSCVLSKGEGVHCIIVLHLSEGEWGWSTADQPMQRYSLAGMRLSLMLPIDVSPDNQSTSSGHPDTLHWRCTASGEQDENLSLHVSDWANVVIADRLKTLFRLVLTEGFSAHSLILQQRILAVMDPQACIRTGSGDVLSTSRRTICLIKGSEEEPCLILLMSLEGESPDTALPEAHVRMLQPVVPSALQVKENACSVLIAPQRLPGWQLPALLCEVFEQAQRMPILIGDDTSLPFVIYDRNNAFIPDALSFKTCSISGDEVTSSRSCDLVLQDQETSWFVTVDTLKVTLSEDKLQLFYRWFPTHLPLVHQQVTQIFTLDAGMPSLEQGSTAVAFRLTSETIKNECSFLTSSPMEWYSDRVQLSQRIAGALQSRQTLISLKLFDALPLTNEHGYVNGGLFISSALNR